MEFAGRVLVWVMRLIGVVPSAYIGVLAAGNIPNALNRQPKAPIGSRPRSHPL